MGLEINSNNVNNKGHNPRILSEYPEVLTIKDLTEILRIGKNSAYKLIREKKINKLDIENTIRIPKQNVIRYLNDAV